MYTHTPLFWISLPFRRPQSTEFPKVCSWFSLTITFETLPLWQPHYTCLYIKCPVEAMLPGPKNKERKCSSSTANSTCVFGEKYKCWHIYKYNVGYICIHLQLRLKQGWGALLAAVHAHYIINQLFIKIAMPETSQHTEVYTNNFFHHMILLLFGLCFYLNLFISFHFISPCKLSVLLEGREE